ncbi:unnamed protein product [Hermetia illucens]|uniref:Major facilitator superfamily (MFS) profile domain-containing protein n=1 Tax=Hermetia illucens TaxID=343691 RepID=A0A7R8UZ89_HERIL|nr:facilitated trehalose transporter Tret1-like [Hermetia illucens]CAD7088659.1 unnamed protein product [Hermetia illucens]
MTVGSVNFGEIEKYKYQILATLAVNIIMFSHGNAIGWLAPTLPTLQSEDSPLTTGPITIEEASWIGSIICVGGVTGSLTFGLLVNRIGCKLSLYLLAVPHVCFWLVLIFGTIVPHLYIARILCGITGGAVFVVIPTYVADIADNKIRGMLGSLLVMNFNGGILCGFILGSYLSYSLFPRIIIALSVIFAVLIFFLPDTPQYYIRRKKDHEALNSLKFYRNFKATTKEECQEFNEHLANLKNQIHGSEDRKPTKLTYQDFLKPAAVRGLLIGIGLMFLNQFSGLFALVNYTVNIFQASGSTMDPHVCTIIVGSIQLLGTIFAAYLVDRIGRRVLLVTSCIGVTVGSYALSIFSYLSVTEDLTHLSWIAVTSLSFAIFLGSFGVLPLPFVVLTEILPQKVKAVAVTIATCSLPMMAFAILRIYPIMMVDLGMYGTMWICGGITAVGAIMIFFFVPETKGKNLEISEEDS